VLKFKNKFGSLRVKVVHCNEYDTGSQSLEVCDDDDDDDDADYSLGHASATYGMRAMCGTRNDF
jgi:hypothetical protein